MELPTLKPTVKQRSAVYVGVVIGAFLVVWAIAWFIWVQILGPVQVTGRALAQNFGGANSTYINVDQFLTGLITFISVLALFGLAQWVWVTMQRKNAGGYYGG